jgi:hypothetical protein
VIVAGINQLRAAAGLLKNAGGDCPGRAAMLAATAEVWSAMDAGLDEWPWELQIKAVPVQFRLVRYGSPAVTVRRLAGSELADLRRALLEFVEAAEALDQVFGSDAGRARSTQEEGCR